MTQDINKVLEEFTWPSLHEWDACAYKDLFCSCDFVFKALVNYGLFFDKLPPCFDSSFLSEYENFSHQKKFYGYINYYHSGHTKVKREFGIPTPQAYLNLCLCIKNNWDDINKHIGKPRPKVNFCHVRKIPEKPYIFETDYELRYQNHIFEVSATDSVTSISKNTQNLTEEQKEKLLSLEKSLEMENKTETLLDYAFGKNYLVKTDISRCFPSIYTHSIPWAVLGKKEAKEKQNDNKEWSNKLDEKVRYCKNNETNGLLIGPHAFNIVAEIILTQVDCYLLDKKHTSLIRHIDDYSFWADTEEEANSFIHDLSFALKEYQLLLNEKKTEIIKLPAIEQPKWKIELNRFALSDNLYFSKISQYLDLALALSEESHSDAALTYAIKVLYNSIAKAEYEDKKLYIKKVLNIAIHMPYLLPLLEKYVLSLDVSFDKKKFLKELKKKSLQNGWLDGLAFAYYFAIKYKVKLEKEENEIEQLIKYKDCISLFLAYKYYEKKGDIDKKLSEHIENILTEKEQSEKDKYWLIIYELSQEKDFTDREEFFKKLKKDGRSFYKEPS